MSPIAKLFQSRRFVLLLLDTVVSIILFYSAKFLPESIEDIKYLIGILQPIAIALIVAYTVEDVQSIKANSAEKVASLMSDKKS